MTARAEVSLEQALRAFEIAEANLSKLDRLWQRILEAMPEGISFGEDPDYADLCRAFDDVAGELPAIGTSRLEYSLYGVDEIAQMRLDAEEIKLEAPTARITVEEEISSVAGALREYRYRLNRARRQLVRGRVQELIDSADALVQAMKPLLDRDYGLSDPVTADEWGLLEKAVLEVGVLIGPQTEPPSRWGPLHRHLRFAQMNDLNDIVHTDWPNVKAWLLGVLYGEEDPIPSPVTDLAQLVSGKPVGTVSTGLRWDALDAEDFERLIYVLVARQKMYRNPQWLIKTSAPDSGRDLSAERITEDPLAGERRERVIVQCKHWLAKSISPEEVAEAAAKMKLWEPPLVRVLAIATSGRFTKDAVQYIEKRNQEDHALVIEMWPESHLELLLAGHPELVEEFSLR
jgi:hypothetical protein